MNLRDLRDSFCDGVAFAAGVITTGCALCAIVIIALSIEVAR